MSSRSLRLLDVLRNRLEHFRLDAGSFNGFQHHFQDPHEFDLVTCERKVPGDDADYLVPGRESVKRARASLRAPTFGEAPESGIRSKYATASS